MISNIEKPLKVNPTLATLLSELGEECETVLFLRPSAYQGKIQGCS